MPASAHHQSSRTDAVRNRARILEVAEQAFGKDGLSVPMDTIAKRAKVGGATLYRHFPTHDALVAAVLQARVPDLDRERNAIEDERVDSRQALERWLKALSSWMKAFDGLPAPLRTGHRDHTSPLAPTCQEVIATTDLFLRDAQRDGHARKGLRGRDLYLGTLAAVWAAGTDAADDSVEQGLSQMLRAGWATSDDAHGAD